METSFVTVLVAELVGSAALLQGAGGTGDREAQLARMRATAEAHGGRAVSATGDGLTLAFASPAGATHCAIALHRDADAGGRQLRIGVGAGEASGEGEALWGLPVLVARRLAAAAAPGELLASELVRQITAGQVAATATPAGTVRLEGLAEPVALVSVAWQPGDDDVPPETPAAPVRPITVVIADDQRLLRAGFKVILEAEPGITVVGEAADGRAAIDVITRRRPDVVLMDIRMPELDGLSAAERILADPELTTAVVMLTTFDASEYVYEALRIGASGFLLKDTPSDRLLDAVRVAAAGEALIAPSITRRLIADFTRAARPATSALPPELAELTAREVEVLRLIARGRSNPEIAADLVLSENTVKTHVARLLGKLGLRDRVQAVVLAYETGLAARD